MTPASQAKLIAEREPDTGAMTFGELLRYAGYPGWLVREALSHVERFDLPTVYTALVLHFEDRAPSMLPVARELASKLIAEGEPRWRRWMEWTL